MNGKNILITGGTGSFGQMFTEHVLNNYSPKKLIIFSRDECKQYNMAQRFSPDTYPCLRYFIGDVRDRERLYRAFSDVDIVIHAAALKHVPIGEYNPMEVIKTNIIGASNVIEAAIDKGVKKVLALSTDKAAAPINLYGATKLCSDKLFIAGNSYVGENRGTVLSVVRYGNVMSSRGSVIPFFIEQKTNGCLPITDPRMTRFWTTLGQSVRFVLKCLDNMVGGEIFIPKLPSMGIMDLAEAIAPGCKTRVVGVRPGEKLHEVLVPRDEARNTLEYGHHFIIKPTLSFFDERMKPNGGKPVAEDFEYNSKTNPVKLTVEQLRKEVERYDPLRQA